MDRIRHQLRTIGTGLVACLACYISASSLPLLFDVRLNDAMRAVLVLTALTVGSGSIAYAIVHVFLDAKLLARRGILYAVACAVLVGVYLGVISQVRAWLIRVTHWDANVLEPVFLVVALILFQPAIARLEELLEKAFLRDPSDYRNVLRQLGADVLTTLDLDELLGHSIETIADALLLRDAHIVALPPGDGVLVRTGAGDAPDAAQTAALRETLRRLPLERAALRLTEPTPGLDMDGRRLLVGALHARLAIPLRARDEVFGVLLLGDKHTRTSFTSEDVQLLASLARQMAVSLQNAFLVRSRVEVARFEEELELARRIQRTFLLSDFPALPGFDVFAQSIPAKHVGGDLYDLVVADDGAFFLAIADVSGKGVPAALLSSMLQAAVRTQAGGGASVREIVARTNALVYRSTAIEQFATFVLARVDAHARSVTFTNAGHNYPVLMRTDGSRVALDRGGILLGIQDGFDFEEVTLPFTVGDRLVFFTDGLSEAVNAANEQFGEERLAECVAALPADASAREIAEHLMAEVAAWIGDAEPGDDCTVLVLRALAPVPAVEPARV